MHWYINKWLTISQSLRAERSIEGLYFDGEKLYFNGKEDDLLDDNEEIYMINTKGSL